VNVTIIFKNVSDMKKVHIVFRKVLLLLLLILFGLYQVLWLKFGNLPGVHF